MATYLLMDGSGETSEHYKIEAADVSEAIYKGQRFLASLDSVKYFDSEDTDDDKIVGLGDKLYSPIPDAKFSDYPFEDADSCCECGVYYSDGITVWEHTHDVNVTYGQLVDLENQKDTLAPLIGVEYAG